MELWVFISDSANNVVYSSQHGVWDTNNIAGINKGDYLLIRPKQNQQVQGSQFVVGQVRSVQNTNTIHPDDVIDWPGGQNTNQYRYRIYFNTNNKLTLPISRLLPAIRNVRAMAGVTTVDINNLNDILLPDYNPHDNRNRSIANRSIREEEQLNESKTPVFFGLL